MPFDLSFIIRPFIKSWAATLVIISENDLWFNFLQGCRESGAAVIMVNGKLSERSLRRFSLLPSLFKRLSEPVSHIVCQNQLYKQRLIEAGYPIERLTVSGNLKSQGGQPNLTGEQRTLLSHFLGSKAINSSSAPLLVIGSTHANEEIALVQALYSLFKQHEVRICIAPRHPERFDKVAQELRQEGYHLYRFSELSSGLAVPEQKQYPILLLDTMGLLSAAYDFADLAIVGGSFTPGIGGHNILEPALSGTPVLFGPHMQNQPDMLEQVLHSKAGCQVESYTSAAEKVYKLSSSSADYDLLKEGCRSICTNNVDPLSTTVAIVQEAVRQHGTL